jgi:hypothetical protein
LQFALPRAVAAIIDVEHVPKLARNAGVHDLRFKYNLVGHAVYITCSREIAARLLESLRDRIRTAAVPRDHVAEYEDAVQRIQQALGVDTTH